MMRSVHQIWVCLVRYKLSMVQSVQIPCFESHVNYMPIGMVINYIVNF